MTCVSRLAAACGWLIAVTLGVAVNLKEISLSEDEVVSELMSGRE